MEDLIEEDEDSIELIPLKYIEEVLKEDMIKNDYKEVKKNGKNKSKGYY